jgi:hypothetical protein
VRRALGVLLGLLARVWLATLRLTLLVDPALTAARPRPFALAFWHGQQFALLRWARGRPMVALVSLSRDGELVAAALGRLGIAAARGSSSRGGTGALKAIVRRLRGGLDAAFAVDGPRGPARVVRGDGAALAARLAGGVVVPMAAACGRCHVFTRSWDRFELPLPFTRVAVALGAPIEPGEAAPAIIAAAVDRARLAAEAALAVGAEGKRLPSSGVSGSHRRPMEQALGAGAGTRVPSRRWPGLAVALAALVHAVCLRGGLLDADRLLLVKNPEIRSFSGLAAMLAQGEPVLRAAALSTRNHGPLGVLSTWLGWQWFRAGPVAQHALGLASLVAVLVALAWLLSALRVSAALSSVAILALALHPATADLTGPILGREALLAVSVALVAARRARNSRALPALGWAAGASLVAGLLAPGWGLVGLIAAAVIRAPRARREAAGAAVLATIAALAVTRGAGAVLPAPDAIDQGASAVLVGWLPSAAPFAIATAGAGGGAAVLVVMALAGAAIYRSLGARDDADAALLRAGAAAMLAAVLAAALTRHEGTVLGAPTFALQLGVVLALAGSARAHAGALTAWSRPWMLAVLAAPAALTALRARAWADEDRVLDAIVARDADDPEALLARARLALRQGHLDEAAPWCLRYATSAPTTFRADGCIAAMATAQEDEAAAVFLLRRWAGRFDDRRALRAAVLELAEAQPDPHLAAAFQRATGFNMPARRPGETL